MALNLTDLQALESDWVMPTYARQPVEFVRGEGCRLWDADGNEYLDFLAGISVVQIGHCHPALVEAIREQVGQLMHVSNLFYTEPGMRLARRLAERSLGGKVFFANSGAEANECAIKLARRHRRGGDIVVLSDGFHGRTYGSLSATPQETKQEPFAPLVPGFKVVRREDAAGIDAVVDDRTAAIFIEPVQGESGIHPIPAEVIVAAREACDRHGALLMFDEIQCGMGRTGTLWAYRAARRAARRDDARQGARRRPADRRLHHLTRLRRRAAPRRSRLDLRGRPGAMCGGARRARRRRRRVTSSRTCASKGEALRARPRAGCPWPRPLARPDGGLRRGRRPRPVAAACCSTSGWW